MITTIWLAILFDPPPQQSTKIISPPMFVEEVAVGAGEMVVG